MRSLDRAVALWVGLLAAGPGPALAQVVETVGSADVALDRRLDRLLEADPLVITADTRVRVGDTIPGSVLVLDATVIHEGTILGDLVLVDAGAFVRPPAEVTGDLVNIGGGLYRSELARVGGTIIDLPEASYRVIREPDRIVIEAAEAPTRLVLDGWKGFRAPSYDRVNGVTAAWGAGYRLPRLRGATPAVRGHAGWRTELGEPVYGGSLAIRGRLGEVEGGYEKGWATHDDWRWGDLRNSLNYLWDGDDFRDYYEAERSWVALSREFGDESKWFFGALRLEAQIENGRSLPGDEPWHLLGDSVRSNPPVDPGRITSAIARLEVEWHGLVTDLVAGAEYEAAREWEGGDYVFDRATAWAGFGMQALMNHTLEIRAYGQLPLGQDTLPRQRRTMVGGPGTLQTVPTAAYRGDHVLFVESRYSIPVPVAFPLLGAPDFELVHAAGMAWLGDADPTLLQEVGAGIRFVIAYVQYMVQPEEPSRDTWLVGIAWPFAPDFPWEPR